jgi:hypothetical protein
MVWEGVSQVRFVRNHDGDGLLCIRGRMYTDIRNVVAGFVYRLESLQGNVLDFRQDDKRQKK